MKMYKTLLMVVVVIGLATGVSNAALSVITVQDNFNDGDFTNNPTWAHGGVAWNVQDTWGTYTYDSNFIRPYGAGSGTAVLVTGSGTLVDKWELEFDVQWGLGKDNFYMEVRNDSYQGYGVQWNEDDTIRIFRRSSSTVRSTLASSTLAQSTLAHGVAANPFYTVKLIREDRMIDGDDTNDNICLYVDDSLLCSFNERDDSLGEFDASTATKLFWYDTFASSTAQTKFLDNVTLSTIPEPATMTLLLLGLPFALRRRR